jgi:hypothetical protein
MRAYVLREFLPALYFRTKERRPLMTTSGPLGLSQPSRSGLAGPRTLVPNLKRLGYCRTSTSGGPGCVICKTHFGNA